jgi:integrase
VGDVKVSPKGVVYLELKNSKAGRRQVRVVAKFARPYISRLISQRKAEGADATDPLFVFYYASGKVRGRIDQLTLVRVFKKYCAIFGIKAAPHSARATFATKLKSMGFSDRETADALGHLTEEMVRVYDKRAKEVEDSPAIKLVY